MLLTEYSVLMVILIISKSYVDREKISSTLKIQHLIVSPNRDFSRAKNKAYLTYVRQQTSSSLEILFDSKLVFRLECGSSLVDRLKC